MKPSQFELNPFLAVGIIGSLYILGLVLVGI